MSEYRKGLPERPGRILALPLDERGYPIPWFVAEVDGKRDFRIADGEKRVRAVQKRLCWLCGEKLGRYLAFVLGPMCAVNRNTSEPPCHRECAEYAVRACPFLMLPKAEYRNANLPEGSKMQVGSLPGNPGASCIWITKTYKPYRVPGAGPRDWLIRVGYPVEVLWFAEGAPATRQQILDSIGARLHFLEGIAKEDGPEAEQMLREQYEKTMVLLPTT